MTLPLFISLFAVNFLYVMLKALNQKSVQNDKRMFVFPVSMAMSACEVFMVGSIATLVVATNSYWAFFPSGLGAATGCLLGMELYSRFVEDR